VNTAVSSEAAMVTHHQAIKEGKASKGGTPLGKAPKRVFGLEQGLATRRTPWPDAGCNKPAKRRVEQPAEVVRNDKSGTCLRLAPQAESESSDKLGVDTQC
jgi:hypothetical protein